MKRWETIKDHSDVDRLINEWKNIYKCNDCERKCEQECGICFENFMEEEIG